MSSEKKPQPVERFDPEEIGMMLAVDGEWVRYSDHEATVEALRAERDEARKDAHHWKANYDGLLSVADSRARALLSDGGRS